MLKSMYITVKPDYLLTYVFYVTHAIVLLAVSIFFAKKSIERNGIAYEMYNETNVVEFAAGGMAIIGLSEILALMLVAMFVLLIVIVIAVLVMLYAILAGVILFIGAGIAFYSGYTVSIEQYKQALVILTVFIMFVHIGFFIRKSMIKRRHTKATDPLNKLTQFLQLQEEFPADVVSCLLTESYTFVGLANGDLHVINREYNSWNTQFILHHKKNPIEHIVWMEPFIVLHFRSNVVQVWKKRSIWEYFGYFSDLADKLQLSKGDPKNAARMSSIMMSDNKLLLQSYSTQYIIDQLDPLSITEFSYKDGALILYQYYKQYICALISDRNDESNIKLAWTKDPTAFTDSIILDKYRESLRLRFFIDKERILYIKNNYIVVYLPPPYVQEELKIKIQDDKANEHTFETAVHTKDSLFAQFMDSNSSKCHKYSLQNNSINSFSIPPKWRLLTSTQDVLYFQNGKKIVAVKHSHLNQLSEIASEALQLQK